MNATKPRSYVQAGGQRFRIGARMLSKAGGIHVWIVEDSMPSRSRSGNVLVVHAEDRPTMPNVFNADELVPADAIVVCEACEAPLVHEAAAEGWVDTTSGDEGGTYDHCPKRNSRTHRAVQVIA